MPVSTRSGRTGNGIGSIASDPPEPKPSSSNKKTSSSSGSSHSSAPKVQKPARKPSTKYHPTFKSSDSPETLAAPGIKKITPNPGASLIAKLPRSTVKELNLKEPLEPNAKTLFALFLAADLASACIGHDIAFNTARRLMEMGWDDVKKLQGSSWAERTALLTEGGYTRYRERTATFLGDVAGLVVEKYGRLGGDLNNLFETAGGDIEKTRDLLKEFKGMGDVGVDIFLRDAQMFFDYLVPFADAKALKAAERAGIGKTAEEMYAAVGKDPKKLSALCTSLVVQGF